jgi:hypothetical protein
MIVEEREYVLHTAVYLADHMKTYEAVAALPLHHPADDHDNAEQNHVSDVVFPDSLPCLLLGRPGRIAGMCKTGERQVPEQTFGDLPFLLVTGRPDRRKVTFGPRYGHGVGGSLGYIAIHKRASLLDHAPVVALAARFRTDTGNGTGAP